MMSSQLQVFLPLATFELDGMTSHINTAWLPGTVELWATFEMNLFKIVGFLEAETSLSGRAEYLLVVGEDEKGSFLEWPSP